MLMITMPLLPRATPSVSGLRETLCAVQRAAWRANRPRPQGAARTNACTARATDPGNDVQEIEAEAQCVRRARCDLSSASRIDVRASRPVDDLALTSFMLESEQCASRSGSFLPVASQMWAIRPVNDVALATHILRSEARAQCVSRSGSGLPLASQMRAVRLVGEVAPMTQIQMPSVSQIFATVPVKTPSYVSPRAQAKDPLMRERKHRGTRHERKTSNARTQPTSPLKQRGSGEQASSSCNHPHPTLSRRGAVLDRDYSTTEIANPSTASRISRGRPGSR